MLSSVVHRLSPIKRWMKDALNDDRSRVVIAIAGGWFLSLGVRMVYPVLLPHLQTAYGIDFTRAGLLLTVLWGAYAIGQLPGGFFTDRAGERLTLTISTLISAAMIILLITAGSTLVVFTATALFGFGTALYGVARFTAISNIYPDNDGAAIGVTLAAGDLGNAILPAVAGAVAATFAWQLGFGVTVPLFIVGAGYLWQVVPPQPSDEAGSQTPLSLETARYVLAELQQPSIITVTVILIFGFSLWQSFTGFYPTYLIEVKGMSPPIATGLFSLYFALGVAVQPLSGRAYDRLGIRRSLPAFFGVTAGALLLLPVVDGFWPLVAVTIPLSSMLGNIAITMPYLTDTLPEEIQGTGLGFLRSVYMIIGAVSPTFFGVLADRGFFDEAFVVMAAMAGLIILLVLRLPAR